MTIQERIDQANQNFNNLQTKKTNLIKEADECQEEMTKLMGEYRVLNELLESQKPKKAKKADTIEVIPEGEKA